MHRSGTTLLEQLLDGHPTSRGLGELYDFTSAMRYATDHHCPGVMDARIVERAADVDFGEVGKRYLDGIAWRLGGEAVLHRQAAFQFPQHRFHLRGAAASEDPAHGAGPDGDLLLQPARTVLQRQSLQLRPAGTGGLLQRIPAPDGALACAIPGPDTRCRLCATDRRSRKRAQAGVRRSCGIEFEPAHARSAIPHSAASSPPARCRCVGASRRGKRPSGVPMRRTCSH